MATTSLRKVFALVAAASVLLVGNSMSASRTNFFTVQY